MLPCLTNPPQIALLDFPSPTADEYFAAVLAVAGKFPKGSMLVGISLGGLVAAKLLQDHRPDLTVVTLASPTHADGLLLTKRTTPNLYALYSHKDTVVAMIARAAQAPLGWAYCMVLTLIGGIGPKVRSDASECPPARLYMDALGPVHYGKSRTFGRVRKLVKSPRPNYIKETNLNSDRALDATFGQDEKDKKENGPLPTTDPDIWAPSYVVYSDEMSTLLRKINIQGSTLASSLCSLYYRSQGSNSDRKGDHDFYVKLSFIGCQKCTGPDDFKLMWQSNTAEGLCDRMLLVPGPSKAWQFDENWVAKIPEFPRTQSEIDAYAWHDGPVEVTTHVKLHVFDPIDEWQRAGEGRERVAELAKRVSIISAAANNDGEILPANIAAALEFAKWQEKVRRVYSPSEAQSEDAAITGAILDAFTAETRKLMAAGAEEPYWIEYRKVSVKQNWSRRWGAAVTRAWKHLVTDGLLDQQMVKGEHGIMSPASPIRLKLAYKAVA
jgi:pimeloyl-ACP methyl ester carboxylesterase